MKATPGTRERILDAALTLFARQGYTATGTQEIIDLVGVTKPVLDHWFASKRALILALADAIYAGAEAEWQRICRRRADAPGRLRGYALTAFAGAARDPRVPRLLMQTAFGPPVAELQPVLDRHTARRFVAVRDVMQQGLARGELLGGEANSLALLYCCILDQHINLLSRLPDAAGHLTPARARALVQAFLAACATQRPLRLRLPPLQLPL